MATICKNGEMDEWIQVSESFSVFYFQKKGIVCRCWRFWFHAYGFVIDANERPTGHPDPSQGSDFCLLVGMFYVVLAWMKLRITHSPAACRFRTWVVHGKLQGYWKSRSQIPLILPRRWENLACFCVVVVLAIWHRWSKCPCGRVAWHRSHQKMYVGYSFTASEQLVFSR